MKFNSFLFKLYSGLFLFMSINREFKPLGIDLRFFILPVGVILLLMKIIKIDKTKSHIGKLEKSFLVFYFFLVISNIMWISNGIDINSKEFFNQMILHINNLMFIAVCILYQNEINIFVLIKTLKLSTVILLISQIVLFFGKDLQILMSSDYPGYYSGGEHYNLFMQNIRFAGFAQDPNYACLFFSILLIIILFFKTSIFEKFIYIIICLLGISLSFSRTIFISLIFSIIFILIMQKNINMNKLFLSKRRDIIFFLIPIILVILLGVSISFVTDVKLVTVGTRLSMWKEATQLFLKNPILGNGITAFRSHYLEQGHWYVQAHSTIFQILSEIGLVGIFSYGYIYKQLSKINQIVFLGLIILMTVFSINFEIIYLQIFPVIFYTFAKGFDNHSKPKSINKALFFVNSLGQGGAEKVCINMANSCLKEGYDVELICLYENRKLSIDKKIKVYNLNLKVKKNKVLRILEVCKSVYLVNDKLRKSLSDTNYVLITSHLPFSNFLSYYSIVSKETLYVMHTPCSKYQIFNETFFGCLLRILFFKRKVVTVSNGIKEEMVNVYNFSSRQIKTIYNPIDLKQIDELKYETLNFNKKYILSAGRLTKLKRFDRLIDIYKYGNFQEEFDLVILGDGEERVNLENKIKDYDLKNKVHLIGFESNVYKWMYNAEVYVLVSDYEGFPMVLIEALASGSKVVSANCDYGPVEILTGNLSNFLVNDIVDINEYINKIRTALTSYPGNEKTNIIKRCDDKNVIYEYLNYYKEGV